MSDSRRTVTVNIRSIGGWEQIVGNIGAVRVHYDVLPIPAFGVEDADRWTVDLPEIVRVGTVGGADARGDDHNPAGRHFDARDRDACDRDALELDLGRSPRLPS